MTNSPTRRRTLGRFSHDGHSPGSRSLFMLAQFTMSRTFQNGSAFLLVSRAGSRRQKFDVSNTRSAPRTVRESIARAERLERDYRSPIIRDFALIAIFPAGNSHPHVFEYPETGCIRCPTSERRELAQTVIRQFRHEPHATVYCRRDLFRDERRWGQRSALCSSYGS